ncbi:MAG: DUF4142 domain-containing protein [Burkholderiales bacterium]
MSEIAMRRRITLSASLTALLLLPAGAPAWSAEPQTAALPAPLAAAEYVAAVRESDRFTVEASNLARDRGQDAGLRDYGQTTATAHERMTQQFGFIASDLALPGAARPPLSERHQAILTELRNAPPGEFDARYLGHQIAAHEEILRAHRAYAASDDNPRLRTFAGDIATRLQRELERAQALQTR